MSQYAQGTFTGNYQPSSKRELANAELIIGHEFGLPSEGHGRVNTLIAKFILEQFNHLPVYAAKSVAGAMRELNPSKKIDGEINGTSANALATRGGTWEDFRQVIEMTGAHKRVVIVGQAYHAGRIALHAEKAGFFPLLPPGLPTEFDPDSVQRWCHGPRLWAVREIVGVPILRLRGEI